MSTVVTDAWISRALGAVEGDPFDLGAAYFRIGEGGWSGPSGLAVPRVPDPALTNLDVVANPSRYPADRRWFFEKALEASDFEVLSATELRISCRVGTGEANLNDASLAPEFWELGVFDGDDTMIAYSTFNRQPKNDTVLLQHRITLRIARP